MKKNLGTKIGQNRPKSGWKSVFCCFLKCGSLVFLNISQDCSLRQCLTSSRVKTSRTKFCGPNLGQIIFSILMLLSIHSNLLVLLKTIVCKGVPAPLLLKYPPVDPACTPFLKSLFPSPLFYSTPVWGILGSFPHPHATPYCPNPTNQPSLV